VVAQGIPDRFTELLKQLDHRDEAEVERRGDEDKA
jgi:hypothetical protein